MIYNIIHRLLFSPACEDLLKNKNKKKKDSTEWKIGDPSYQFPSQFFLIIHVPFHHLLKFLTHIESNNAKNCTFILLLLFHSVDMDEVNNSVVFNECGGVILVVQKKHWDGGRYCFDLYLSHFTRSWLSPRKFPGQLSG